MRTLLFNESIDLVILICVIMFIFKQFNLVFICCIVLLLFLMYTYRVPKRRRPEFGGDIVTAPSDGRVISIEKTKERMFKISIQVSILDVHIQWYPVEGIVRNVLYKPLKFKYTDLFKQTNKERYTTILQHDKGIVRVDQIGGLIGRCIENKSISNTIVRRGNIMGAIATQVDVYLPVKKTELFVEVNDTIVGKTSAIAKWI